jgi:hypothetical protein
MQETSVFLRVVLTVVAVPAGYLLAAVFWGLCLPQPTKEDNRQYMPSRGAMIAGRLLGAGALAIYSIFMLVMAAVFLTHEFGPSDWWPYPLFLILATVPILLLFGPPGGGIARADKQARRDGRLTYVARPRLPDESNDALGVWEARSTPPALNVGRTIKAGLILLASLFTEIFMWMLAVGGPIQAIGVVARDYGGVAGVAATILNGIPYRIPPPTSQLHTQIRGLARWSLILGILSLGATVFTGVPAVICGHIALSRIKRFSGAPSGKGLAVGGLTLGYTSIAFFVFIMVTIATGK